MHLSIADIKKYVPTNYQYDADNLETAEIRALYKYFPKYLGRQLTELFDTEMVPAELTDKIKPVLANYAYLLAVPFLDLVSTKTGFAVVRNNQMAPASRERVDAFMHAVQEATKDFTDELLAFLEDNKDDVEYLAWNKCCINDGYLVSSVSVLNAVVNINESRTFFIELISTLNRFEVDWLKPLLSTEFYAELLGGNDTLVKPKVIEALVYRTLYEVTKDTQDEHYNPTYLQASEMCMESALNTLANNLETYTTYATYGYAAPYKNSEDFEGENFHS